MTLNQTAIFYIEFGVLHLALDWDLCGLALDWDLGGLALDWDLWIGIGLGFVMIRIGLGFMNRLSSFYILISNVSAAHCPCRCGAGGRGCFLEERAWSALRRR